ncbi:MAG TPA: hypothetical protein VMU85_11665 [Stellaceae bacterium]|nr:hypothetical protein [Stellaceae bacterium]
MPVIFVARSSKLGKWASDVGLSKHVYKVGVAEASELKAVVASGWAGEADWAVVKKETVEAITEEDAIARLAAKQKMIDPNLYPRLRGTTGVFKVLPAQVENHILVARALSGASELSELKLKPADFGEYLIHNALK